MRYRAFRIKGQVIDAIFATDGEFTASPEAQAEDLARAWGVPPSEVVAWETDEDPTPLVQAVLPRQKTSPSSADPDEAALQAALANPSTPAWAKALIRRTGAA